MTFDPMSVEVTCVTLPKDHCFQVPWQYINVCGYSDQFCKIPHTYYVHTTYILYYVQNEWSHSLSLNSVQARQKWDIVNDFPWDIFNPLWIHVRPSGRVMVSLSWNLCVQRKDKRSMTRRRTRMPTLLRNWISLTFWGQNFWQTSLAEVRIYHFAQVI